MLRAIIFDFDGVIADTEELHLKAFQRTLKEEGIELTKEEYYEKYLALDDKGCFREVFSSKGRHITDEKIRELVEKKGLYYEEIMKEGVRFYDGVVDFIRDASRHFPLAIASGAMKREIVFLLRKASVDDCFSVIVSAEDVEKGKPDPEPYIKALTLLNERLRLSPPIKASECVVIEDSIHGVKAASRAGMHCIAVTNSYPGEKFKALSLLMVVNSLKEVYLSYLKSML